MTAFVKRVKVDIAMWPLTVSMEVQRIYDDMGHVVKWKIQQDLDDTRKNIRTHFQVGWTRLVRNKKRRFVTTGSLDIQSSLGKRSPLFSSRVTEALEVGCSGRLPSSSARRSKRPRNRSRPRII